MNVMRNTDLLGPLLDRVRLPIVSFLVLFATVQHVVMLNSPAQWRLSTMLVAYAVVIPALGWLALWWLARFAHRVERVQKERLEALTSLRRRNRQIEGLYSASRLIADGYAIEPLLESLDELAMNIAGAEGAGIRWRPETDQVARIVLTGSIDRAAIETGPTDQGDDGRHRYVPLSSDGHALGWIGLNGATWDATTRHSLELLAQEVGNLWQLRRSESRTWAALSAIGRSVEDLEDLQGYATSFLAAMSEAMGAIGATLYRRDGNEWHRRIVAGAQAHAPSHMSDTSIWRDEAQQAIYVAADADNVLALVFDRLPSKLARARERQLLQLLSSQAAWLLQATDAAGRMLARERSRVAAELHDGLSQTLAYLHLQVRHALEMLNEGRKAPASRTLEELSEVALEAYQSVRRAVEDLRLQPEPWETPIAFLERIARAAARNELTVKFTAKDINNDYPAQVLRTVASILQEAIANATCHGHAHRVKVSIHPRDGGLGVLIVDDGSGFDPSKYRPGHHGLELMGERIEALGGQFAINSTPGAGTVLSLFVPAATGTAKWLKASEETRVPQRV